MTTGVIAVSLSTAGVINNNGLEKIAGIIGSGVLLMSTNDIDDMKAANKIGFSGTSISGGKGLASK